MLTIGLVMLQGARREHAMALQEVVKEFDFKMVIKELRKSADVEGIDGLILPGGETTAMNIASQSEELLSTLWQYLEAKNIPVLATCAGAILLSQNNLIRATIERNAYGGQLHSFQTMIQTTIGEGEFPGVFIRAPAFKSFECEQVASLNTEPIGLLDGNKMALTFHPELTEDLRFHRWLLTSALKTKGL